MEILDALQWRYAVKKFSKQKVTSIDLHTLLNATRLSASSYGLQPYKVIVVASPALRNQLLPFSYGQDKVAYSSHLIVFAIDSEVGEATVERYIEKHAEITQQSLQQLSRFTAHLNDVFNNKTLDERKAWAHQQAYIALGNFLTCAAAMKIDSCPMTGIDFNGYDRVLGLAEKGLTTSVICPIGYRHKDDTQAYNPKVRFDYDEIIMDI